MARRPVNTPYQVTTEFDQVDSYALYGRHSGYDYAVATGTPVYATSAGTIVSTIDHPTRGNMVTLYDGKYYHRFMHNTRFNVKPGQQVNEGDIVAYAGSTGLSTGPHVHWDMNTRGVDTNSFADFVDPDDWLKGRIPQATQPAPAVASPTLVYQRMVRPSSSVYYRDAPNTTGKILQEFPAGDPEPVNFRGWVYGESVGGNNIWFVGRFTNGYSWSGAYTDTSTVGLEDLNTKTTPAPTNNTADVTTPTPGTILTPITPDPIPSAAYSFNKDLPSVNEVIPAGLGSFEYGNFPDQPGTVVLHDFGTHGKDTVESTVSWFRKIDNISAHFVISRNRRIQMVSLKDRAYHAGPKGNNYVGIEIDPAMDDETVASVRMILLDLKAYYGGTKLQLIEHNTIMATLCGDDIDLADFDIDSATPANGVTALDTRVDAIESFLTKVFKDFK